jgi:uncharacterized membrane protein YgdD (TMEM256/DUF423 family)
MNSSPNRPTGKAMQLAGTSATVLGFLCVAGGAFGTHGLEGSIPPNDLDAFETGMRYGLVHALAALVALLFARQDLPGGLNASWCFIVGIVLFTGSLGVLGLTGSRALVFITPLGGLGFLSGWALLAIGFYKDG